MRPRLEQLEARQMLASDWQNSLNPYDVDNSGTVQPLDVFLAVNDFVTNGARTLGVRAPGSTEPKCDVNGDNQISRQDVESLVAGINQYTGRSLTIGVDLTAVSDPNGSEVVLKPNVTYEGTTMPYTKVRVEAVDSATTVATQHVVSGADGKFQFQLNFVTPINHLRFTADDPRLRTKSTERIVRYGDVIAEWNSELLETVRETTAPASTVPGLLVKPPPPLVAKQLAMVQVAMFDAVNAVSPQYHFYALEIAPQTGASEIAAAAAAAHRVASALFSLPVQIEKWDITLAETLAIVPDGPAKTLGLELGRKAADAIIARRANDGSSATVNYVSGNDPGDWQPTPPGFSPATLPQWPTVTPFVINSGAQFRPAAPPALTSPEYAEAVDQVMKLGDADSTVRTADQTAIAKFWADAGGTATPPGHWNAIATDILLQRRSALLEGARTMALLNLALADAAISSWDAKYFYDLWRPIDAIRKANTDGNSATNAKADWTPLLNTPSFPSYTSGHSTFSGAASEVLSSIFGENFSFSSLADRGAAGIWPAPDDVTGLARRSFTSFDAAAEEAGMSRIYGGIHFNFDNTAGLAAGRSIGQLIVNAALLPLAEE
ncbi:MAG: vanadium-dependent haloperoxidase [Pirellulaceae bacterium]|nr:vanadium-dependent haloperoxidase [Pirellulaceae bacterium]